MSIKTKILKMDVKTKILNLKDSRMGLLISNFVIYGGTTIAVRAIPLIMLPIITRLLPDTSTYGNVDIFNLISRFGSQLCILGMADSVFREYFEKDSIEYKKKVTSTGFFTVLFLGVIFLLISVIFRNSLGNIFYNLENKNELIVLNGLSILIIAVLSIAQIPTKTKNERKKFFKISIISVIFNYLLLLILLYLGYTLKALIFSTLITSLLTTVLYLKLNYKEFNFKFYDLGVLKELLKIGLPIVPVFIAYWVFSSADKLMIKQMIGVKELGIYSIGSKVAQISAIISSAYAGGIQYFRYKTMNDSDQIEMISKIFRVLLLIIFISFIAVAILSKSIFFLLFTGDYILGYTVMPLLFLGPLLLVLIQTISGQFLILKKTYLVTFSLFIGAGSNIILNYIFVKKYGIEGASLSTAIAYFISLILTLIMAKKYKMIKLKKMDVIILIFLILTVVIKTFY